MLKLHVFLVDTGIMFTFEMELALECVSKLMEAISMVTQIPVSKQVLLATNGDPLNPTSRVGSYKSAGTETNPIFLFSKSAIESPQPPSSSLSIRSEAALDEQVAKCLQMPSTYETLVARAKLASEFHLCARELGELCENLIGDQQLQQQGWLAVVSNLDNITQALKAHVLLFEKQYKEFISTQEHYLDMFERFDDVIYLLGRIPVLSCLLKEHVQPSSQNIVLLEWISSKEQKTSLQALVTQCKELLNQFDAKVPHNLMQEVSKVLESSDNKNMKEIKGLNERLVSLQQRLAIAQQFVQDQADMAQGFKQNQMRAEHLGDPSVLPDLCASHQKQLLVLLRNHKQLRDISTLCSKAKDELSTNLHARLRWVMYVEHSICNCDSKLLAFHESLKKMKRRLEVFEQVYEAPRMYILAVLEILRRKSFSTQFLEWGRSVAISSAEARSEEIDKRNKFAEVFGSHFLQSLFIGLDDRPSTFAESPPSMFDDRLPEIDVNDIRLLQHEVPELLTELSLGDPLEQSVYVRERLSQKNLSKLVDPKSNPSLEETLKLRERTGICSMPKMTVSQLQKEISQEDIPLDIASKPTDWQLGDSKVISDRDFEPSSLKTLSSGMDGLQSSQSSDISDSMFRSAEGLDDETDAPIGVIGRLELTENTSPYSEENISTELIDEGYEHVQKSSVRPIPKTSPGRTCPESSPNAILKNSEVSPFISVASPAFRQNAANVKQSTRNLKEDFAVLRDLVFSLKKEYQKNCVTLSRDILDFAADLGRKCDKMKSVETSNEELKDLLLKKKEELEFQTNETRVNEEKFKIEKQYYVEEIERLELELGAAMDANHEKLEYGDEEKLLSISKSEALNEEWKAKEKSYEETITKLKSDNMAYKNNLADLKIKFDKIKNQLEAENQLKFNSALQKVKKEKETTIKELHQNLEVLKTELQRKEEQLSELRAEMKGYEEMNTSILHRCENLEKPMKDIEEKCKMELLEKEKYIDALRNELEMEKERFIEELERNRDNQEEKWKVERTNLEIDYERRLASLEESFDKEKLHLCRNFETEKLKLKEDFEKEKNEIRECLQNEKSALILSFELDKQKYSEELEKQSLSKTSSIEEGIDALEWDKLLQRLKDLEQENKTLKEEQAKIKSSQGIEVDAHEDSLKVIETKEEENEVLKDRIAKLEYQLQQKIFPELSQTICLKQFKINDLVLLCYDDERSNFVALSTDATRYFLHPDSKISLDLATSETAEKRNWFLAYITDQEYCIAKKVHNRFKLPVGTYFYRIHVRRWTPKT